MSSSVQPRVVVSLTCGSVSGVDTFAYHLVRGLRARGRDAHLLLSRPDLPWIPLAVPEDVPCVTLPARPADGWRRRWRRMRRHLEAQGPCVWLPNYDFDHSGIAPLLPAQVAIVGIVHSDAEDHYEHAQRLGAYWDAVVAVSPEVARKTALAAPDVAPRLSVIPYGVPRPPTARRARAGGPLRVVYAGRLDEAQKRVSRLPSILRGALGRGADVTLTVFGDGPSRAALEDASRDLVRAERMSLAGTRPNAEVLAAFGAADVLLLPSAFEGLPLALLEAMAHGCVPVVSALPSGVADVVRPGENGLARAPHDVDGFASDLARLEADRDLLARLSAEAARTVQGRFGIDAMVDAYVELFDRAHADAVAGRYVRPRGALRPPSPLAHAGHPLSHAIHAARETWRLARALVTRRSHAGR